MGFPRVHKDQMIHKYMFFFLQTKLLQQQQSSASYSFELQLQLPFEWLETIFQLFFLCLHILFSQVLPLGIYNLKYLCTCSSPLSPPACSPTSHKSWDPWAEKETFLMITSIRISIICVEQVTFLWNNAIQLKPEVHGIHGAMICA